MGCEEEEEEPVRTSGGGCDIGPAPAAADGAGGAGWAGWAGWASWAGWAAWGEEAAAEVEAEAATAWLPPWAAASSRSWSNSKEVLGEALFIMHPSEGSIH